MPSFDVVSEIDLQEVRNAVDQAAREVRTRFDFKGTDSVVELQAGAIKLESSTAARLIGDGEPLARALEKLQMASGRIPSGVDPNQASAYIVDPLRAQARGGGGSRMFSTHPPAEERIARLRTGDWSSGPIVR